MNGPFILVRPVLQWALILGIVGLANGCTPRLDWREIQLEPIAASALFPAKPVEVSRTLESAKDAASFMLTLRSARIDHTVFAVGWVLDADAEIRSVLESAMLANIGARPESIERKEIQQGDLLIYEVTATGQMTVANATAPVPTRVWMRSLVIADPAPLKKGAVRVVEMIAAGPSHELQEEEARQFIESLRFIR